MTVPKRFDLLRFVATMLKVFAWITLVLSILSAIGVVLAGGQMREGEGSEEEGKKAAMHERVGKK